MHARTAALTLATTVALAHAQCDPATLFAAPTVITLLAGSDPTDIRAADFDGDGNQDLVISEPGTDSLAFLFGHGDGTFDPPVRLGSAQGLRQPERIALGDVTGDGIPDLVVGNGFNTEVVVFRSDGDGTFTNTGAFDTDFFIAPTDMALADIDGDTDLDIVLAVGANQVRTMLNNGSGSFDPPEFTIIIGGNYGLDLGDLNGDGDPDLVVSDFSSGHITVGSGAAGDDFVGLTDYASPFSPAGVRLIDMDGDTDLDIVASCFFSKIAVWINTGAGSFAPQVAYNALGVPRDLDAADLDGDGDQDLLIATGSTVPQTVSVFMNNGDGTLGQEFAFPGGNNAYRARIADLNNDGAPDAAVVCQVSHDVYIYLNTCPGAVCVPDFAAPFGVLNFFDITAFIAAFNAMSPSADLAAPFGTFNFFDIAAFINLFNAGCP